MKRLHWRKPHLQGLPALVGAAGTCQHAAGVGVLLAALAPAGPPAAAAAAEAVEELLQVVAVKVGAAEDQALLHPARSRHRIFFFALFFLLCCKRTYDCRRQGSLTDGKHTVLEVGSDC